jgi:septal ring-binding cell division protein DamX
MEETADRDLDRAVRTAQWNDKIEIRLDNRQVFFLFFGSAVVACMLFVLGVIVGKRLESRGRAEAPEVQDPLAVLDKVDQRPSAVAPVELTFPKTLVSPSPLPQAPKPKLAATTPTPPPVKPTAGAPRPAPAPKPVVAKASPPVVKAPPPVVVKAAPLVIDPAKAPKGKYTLHLASLPTKEEADALARKYPGAFVVAGDVPGKGLLYRVRYGNYASYQEVIAAKAAFERQNKAIALIAAR